MWKKQGWLWDEKWWIGIQRGGMIDHEMRREKCGDYWYTRTFQQRLEVSILRVSLNNIEPIDGDLKDGFVIDVKSGNSVDLLHLKSVGTNNNRLLKGVWIGWRRVDWVSMMRKTDPKQNQANWCQVRPKLWKKEFVIWIWIWFEIFSLAFCFYPGRVSPLRRTNTRYISILLHKALIFKLCVCFYPIHN